MRSASRWVYLVSLILFLPSVAVSSVVIETVRTGTATYSPSGVVADFTFASGSPNSPTRYHQSKPIIPPGTTGKVIKNMSKGGLAGLAVQAAISGLGAGIDYVIENGQVKKQTTEIVGGNLWKDLTYTYCHLNDCYEDVYEDLSQCQLQRGSCRVEISIPDSTRVRARFYYGGTEQATVIDLSEDDWEVLETEVSTIPPGKKSGVLNSYMDKVGYPNLQLDAPALPAPENATLEDLQTLLQGQPYSLVALDQATAELLDMWPSLATQLQPMVNAIYASLIVSMHSQLELTPEQRALLDGITPTPPSDTEVTLELPAFCEWAEWVCRPFVPDPHPDVPTLDLEVEEFDSGLPGDASCPAPYTFETAFTGPIEISFQPACDLAAAIRVPLLAISYLMAGFIVVGVRR